MVSEPAEGVAGAALRRMRDNGIRPNRELGQNFLFDANLLDVVSEAAQVTPEDVVLEVGGGLGILSAHLAGRAKHVHVVEVDERLRPALTEAVEGFGNVTLHFADALRLDFGSLDPSPDKLVANLPYGIAAPLILETIGQLPGCGLWVAMVQREVGERLAAKPGTRAYGAPSALAQCACEVRVLRAVSRQVFRPVPHVDSVLVRLERIGPSPRGEVRDLIHAAFAHRRKALAKSVALTTGDGEIRERIRSALEGMGLAADSRAERLSAAQYMKLADLIAPPLPPEDAS